jgi:hypothetical protein
MVDVSLTVYALYAFSIAQIVLLASAVFYAVRIYRTVGSFKSWTLIMSAFILVAINNVISFISTVTLPPQVLDSLLASFAPTQIWPPQLITLTSSTALAVGLRGLSKVFKPKPAAPSEAMPMPQTR